MKKSIIIIFITIISLTIGLLIYSNYKTIDQMFYTIPTAKSYIYEENRTLSIDVYSSIEKPYIIYKDKNEYYIVSDDLEYSLDIVSIEVSKQEDVYLITIIAKIPSIINTSIKNVYLKIINKKYTLKCYIGSLDILLPNDYTLLSIDKLYASYSYINNVLHLVGINIVFNSPPELIENVMIGSFGYGYINLIKENIYDNEIEIKKVIPDYNAIYNEQENKYSPKGNMFFIPIGYKKITLIKEGYITMRINGEQFYLDTFSFLASDIVFSDYKSLSRVGEIKYA